jgi:hypothetical protein
METKNLLFDIETAPNVSYTWGLYEQDVISVKKNWYMLSFAYKWLGEKKVHAYSLPDFPLYKKDPENDKELCQKLWELMDEAQIVIAHNGVAFDTKKSKGKFLQHGFPPPSPFKEIDTLKVARRYFKFDSNKLDNLGKYLGIGEKINTGGWKLWEGCIKGDQKAWKKMVQYNKNDVVLLEKVYLRMRPYMDNHPNFNLYSSTEDKCPNCGGPTIKQGLKYNRTRVMQQRKCKSCGAWSSKPTNGIIR